MQKDIFTARKRSLRRLCFYTCLLFILFTGGVYPRHPPGRHAPPARHHPPGQTPPRADTPLGRYPHLGRHPPGQTPPLGRHPPGLSTPPWTKYTPQDTVNARAVRILLECKLVQICVQEKITKRADLAES